MGKESSFNENLNAVIVTQRPFASGCVQHQNKPRAVFSNPKPILKFPKPPIDAVHRGDFPLEAACSSTATRASISSISIALAVGVLKLGKLQPSEQGSDSNAGSAGRVLNVALGEQRGDDVLLFASEN